MASGRASGFANSPEQVAVAEVLRGTTAERDPVAAAMLCARLIGAWSELGKSLRQFSISRDCKGNCAPPRNGDVLALDASLANWMTDIDAAGAEVLRRKSAERMGQYLLGSIATDDLYKLWAADARGARFAMARAMWLSRVESEWRHRQATALAAVPRVVAKSVLASLGSGTLTVSADDGSVVGRDSAVLGKVAALDPAVIAAVARGLAQSNSVLWHRLIRMLVTTGHAQFERHAAGEPGIDFRVIEFCGGMSALAAAVHHTSRDFRPLETVLDTGRHITWTRPGLSVGGLWTWDRVQRPAPGLPSVVRVTLGPALLPGFVAGVAQEGGLQGGDRRDRYLVPELRREPPVSALRPNDWGSAWMLHRLFLIELVDRAEDLCRLGSVALGNDRLRELGATAGLPVSVMPKVLDLWQEGESDDAPALLLQPEPGRFTLADPHSLERDFIVAGGKRRIEGRENGRKGRFWKNRR